MRDYIEIVAERQLPASKGYFVQVRLKGSKEWLFAYSLDYELPMELPRNTIVGLRARRS